MATYREEQNERARKIKTALVGQYGRDAVSVRKGRGTAHDWVYVTITLPSKKKPADWRMCHQKERKIIENVEKAIAQIQSIFLAQYHPDSGPYAGQEPCLRVEIRWR